MAGPGDPKRQGDAMDGSSHIYEDVALRAAAAWPAERPAMESRAVR